MNPDKVFFVDVDGTLLSDDKKVSQANADAIHDAQAKGHLVVPTTGCSYESHIKRFTNVDFNYMIASNGAFIYDIKNQKVLHEDFLSTDIALKIYDLVRPYITGIRLHSGVSVGTSIDDAIEYIRNNRLTQIAICGDPEPMKKLFAMLKEFAPANGLCLANYSKSLDEDKFNYEDDGNIGIDIVNVGVGKGEAVKLFCKMFNINPANTVSMGDGFNDLAMFDVTAQSVAMGNALEALKQRATITVADNNNDGVAEGIRRIT